MQHSNARIGLWMFGLYLVFYGGFVLVNAFAPDAMESPAVAGLNLAVSWGFGLILAAVVLALAYGFLCRANAAEDVEGKSK